MIISYAGTHFHTAKHIIPVKLIIQSKSHTNLEFLAQLAQLQKFVVMLVLKLKAGERMRITDAIKSPSLSLLLYQRL